MTLDRILQSQGFGTRKACRHWIREGEVRVNGERVTEFGADISTEGLQLEVCGEPWQFRALVYLALHKPVDIECSRKPSHHPGVHSLLPPQFLLRDVQPVGRLDHDTTGLLLLSDDGAFIHAQSSPKRKVPEALLLQLNQGVKLHDEPLPIAGKARALGSHQLEIVLEQGKYHQVKRMLAAAGNHCDALCRVAIGALRLESLNLAPGQWCYLESPHLGRLRPSDAVPTASVT